MLDWSIIENADTRGVAFWSDNFDSYATGANLHGTGGWKGWLNNPGQTAFTTDAQAASAPNSADIAVSSKLVHEFTGATSGQWIFSTRQYVPGSMTGNSSLELLNEYGADINISTQLEFSADQGHVISWGEGATLPLIMDQWIELGGDAHQPVQNIGCFTRCRTYDR